MRLFVFTLLLFIISCSSSDKSNIIEFIWNNGDKIYKDLDDWYVESEGFIYPGDSVKIINFLDMFKESNYFKINDNPGDHLEFYNISSNKLGEFFIGSLSPGSLGRYAYNNKDLYIIEGDFSNFKLNTDFRYKGFNFSSNNSIYFHFKPFVDDLEIENVSEVLKFDSESQICFNSLLRLDVKDLVPGFEGEIIGEIEIKLDNGSIEIIEIKKGANGYLFNHQAPYSLLVSKSSFSNLINSF